MIGWQSDARRMKGMPIIIVFDKFELEPEEILNSVEIFKMCVLAWPSGTVITSLPTNQKVSSSVL